MFWVIVASLYFVLAAVAPSILGLFVNRARPNFRALSLSLRAAPSTCLVELAECRRLRRAFGISSLTNAADFRPDLECLPPGSFVLGGSDVIAAEMKEVVDLIVG